MKFSIGDIVSVHSMPEIGGNGVGKVVEVREDNLLVKFQNLEYEYVIPKNKIF